MAQTRVSKSAVKTRGSRTALSPQQANLELKQRVISILNKLADRDTYQIAADELGRVAAALTPEGFGPFLCCIFETDSQHKSIVRRECVKTFATLAACHGEQLAPWLPKMVGNIIRRLKDPDSSVRDACVEAMGVLAAKVVHPSGNSGVENGGAFAVFARPLMEALGEQNRQLQAGCALCLARVIDNAENPPTVALQKLLPRIVKLLANQSFSANAALLSVISSIVEAGAASSQIMVAGLVPCMLDSLQSNDWATRKAAAETFGRMALSLGPLLSSFKTSCVAALESCRFDKVKPVRDTVAQTLQAWKKIPDAEVFSPISEKGSTTKENWINEASFRDLKSTRSAGSKSTFLRKSGTAVTISAIDGISVSTAKKRAPLVDTKINPRMPRRLDGRKTDNWHIEVAVPRSCPPRSVIPNEGIDNTHCSEVSGRNERVSKIHDGYRFEDTEMFGKIETSRLSDESRASCETKCIMVDDGSEAISPIDGTQNRKPIPEMSPLNKPSQQRNDNNQHSDCLITDANVHHSTNFVDEAISHNAEDLAFIRKQLSQIENQQSSLMDLLRVFMGRSLDSISNLETRVHSLERIVDEIAEELIKSTGRMEYGKKYHRSLSAEMLKSKFWKRNDTALPSSRLHSSENIQSIHKLGREASNQSEGDSAHCNRGCLKSSSKVKPLVYAWEMSYRGHNDLSPQTVGRPMPGNVEIDQLLPRAFERNTYKEKIAKESVPRGGWLASTDKTSLSGTYMTPEDRESKITGDRNSISGLKSSCSSYENSHFWSVWTRAVEYLCADDVDSAFMEVLHCDDDLLLIQLMKRTGPVLGNLSRGTILRIIQTAIGLLLHQNLLNTIIPWLQQVVSMISNKGPDFLGLSVAEKMEILSALQEASSMHFSDLSTWSSVTQLASTLANVWATDLRSICEIE